MKKETLKVLVDRSMRACDGLKSLTSKLDIGENSIYVKTSWLNSKIVHLDITLSRGGRTNFDDLPKSEAMAQLESDNYDLARSWVEDSCRMASSLLEAGVGITAIIDNWKGVNGFPHGACPQLESVVCGPLHATAFLIERNIEAWKSDIDAWERGE